MEENFLVYYCSSCYVCKKPADSSASMKFCSGCKLIQYCSTEHQKQDWSRHKVLCKCVQQLVKELKMAHVYEDVSSFLPEDFVNWSALRNSFAIVVELKLKRRLTVPEAQMLLFPPVCSYCHLYKVNTMFICQACKSVMYCSKEHQCKDKNHLSVCKFVALSFEIDMFRFKNQTALFNFLSFNNLCMVRKFPENMEMFIKSFTLTETAKGICLSEPLSFSLTLVDVIRNVNLNSNKLIIHIVGADAMEILAMQTFPLIYHLLPYVIHINIVLIGPNVSNEDTIPLCIPESNISVDSVNLLYHEYVASPKFVTPDMIAALNCGFCAYVNYPDKDFWRPSLPSILSFKDTVVIITSYTQAESVSDIERLFSFKHRGLQYSTIMKSKVNPFSSLYPHRDWEYETVYFVNKYISVIKTQAQ